MLHLLGFEHGTIEPPQFYYSALTGVGPVQFTINTVRHGPIENTRAHDPVFGALSRYLVNAEIERKDNDNA
jgi:hypothetical protein